MILDFLIFKKTIARAGLVGIVVGLVGTLIVVTHGEIGELFSGSLGLGEGLFLIAIVGWSVYSIAARPLFASVQPVMITAFTCLTGAILLAPAALNNLDQAVPLLADPGLIALTLLQTIFVIGIGFLWFYEGVKSIGPTRTSVYINLIPIFAIILAALTIGEVPDVSLYIGGALVLVGLVIVNKAESATTE